MTKEQQVTIGKKFFSDPDWVLVDQMIRDYMEPLRDIDTIDVTMDPGAVSAEVAGRQKAYKALAAFLGDCGILAKRLSNNNSSFK